MKMENVAAAKIKVAGNKNETDKNKESKMKNLKTVWTEAVAIKNETRNKLKGLLGAYKATLADMGKSIEAKIVAADLGNPQYACEMLLKREETKLNKIRESIFKITDEK
jgi:hypothetical protein